MKVPEQGPGCIAQSLARLTQAQEILGSLPGSATYFHDSRRAVVSYWQKYMHEILVLLACLGKVWLG